MQDYIQLLYRIADVFQRFGLGPTILIHRNTKMEPEVSSKPPLMCQFVTQKHSRHCARITTEPALKTFISRGNRWPAFRSQAKGKTHGW